MQLYACVLMSDDLKSCLFVCNYNAVNRPVNVVRSLVVCSSNKILTENTSRVNRTKLRKNNFPNSSNDSATISIFNENLGWQVPLKSSCLLVPEENDW